MRRLPTRLKGPILLEPEVHSDERGFFLESYRRELHATFGIEVEFVQDNHSRSGRDTVRGLHFQQHPGQAKLVRVARGRIWDVVVDLRRSSQTFGQWESFELDDAGHRQLYVPIGYAHGFCVLSDIADVVYKVSSYYIAEQERGLAWDDAALAIPWPTSRAVVSPRDMSNQPLSDLAPYLPSW